MLSNTNLLIEGDQMMIQNCTIRGQMQQNEDITDSYFRIIWNINDILIQGCILRIKNIELKWYLDCPELVWYYKNLLTCFSVYIHE